MYALNSTYLSLIFDLVRSKPKSYLMGIGLVISENVNLFVSSKPSLKKGLITQIFEWLMCCPDLQKYNPECPNF